MGNFYSTDEEPKDIPPPLTLAEKEEIAKKRVVYLGNKYPPPKSLDTTKRVFSTEKDLDQKHETYIRDVCS
jgi:hypothetical protein